MDEELDEDLIRPLDETDETEIDDTDDPDEEPPYESILIVEDGTGLPNANSYVSLNFADDYLGVRSKTWSTYSNVERETALICATDFVNSVFQWKGKKMTQEQSLAFPRTDLVDLDGYTVEGVPLCLKQAVCDCADLVSTGTELFQTHEANGDVVSEKIGELAFTYNKAKSEEGTVWNTLYDSVNAKLRGLYIDKSSNGICWSRIVK